MSPMLLLLTYLWANVSICNQMWQFTFADFSTFSINHWHFANNANGFRLNDSYWFPHKLFVTAHQVKYYVPQSITANDISLFICLYTSNVVFSFLAKYIYIYTYIWELFLSEYGWTSNKNDSMMSLYVFHYHNVDYVFIHYTCVKISPEVSTLRQSTVVIFQWHSRQPDVHFTWFNWDEAVDV